VGKKETRWASAGRIRLSSSSRLPNPAANLLGRDGEGFAVMMKTLDFSRPAVAARPSGSRRLAGVRCRLCKQRESFGKPIIRHQGIGFKLADMAMETEAARHLLYKTCALFQEQPKDMSRLNPALIRFSSMSKCYCGDVAMRASIEAVQVLGGYGYVKEFPVERMMRDAKITQIYEGTNEIQRMVISNTL